MPLGCRTKRPQNDFWCVTEATMWLRWRGKVHYYAAFVLVANLLVVVLAISRSMFPKLPLLLKFV